MSGSRPVTLTAALFLAGVLASGCGKKVAAVCETKCGNATEAQTCTEAEEKSEATAEERGCESEFEDFVSCADAKGVCTNGVLDAAKPCAAEIKALATCAQ